MSDCIKSGNHHTLDPSIDDGKWFSAKVLKENAKLQANCSLSSLPFVPSTDWRAFLSQNIPSLFNYGHVHYYALELAIKGGGRPTRLLPHAKMLLIPINLFLSAG